MRSKILNSAAAGMRGMIISLKAGYRTYTDFPRVHLAALQAQIDEQAEQIKDLQAQIDGMSLDLAVVEEHHERD